MLNKQCLQNVGQLLHNIENDFFVEAYAKWKWSKLMENGKKLQQKCHNQLLLLTFTNHSAFENPWFFQV